MPLPHCGCPYPGQDSPPQQTRVKEKKREGKGREGKEEEGPPPPPRNQLGARNPTGTSWGAPFASGPAYKPRCRRRCSRVSLLAASYAPLYVTASRGKWRPLSPPSPCTGLTRPAWQGQGYQGEAKQPPFCLWAAARSAPAEPSVSILQTGSRLGAAEGAERGIAKTPSSAASPPPTSAPASSSRPACRSAVPILGGSQPEGNPNGGTPLCERPYGSVEQSRRISGHLLQEGLAGPSVFTSCRRSAPHQQHCAASNSHPEARTTPQPGPSQHTMVVIRLVLQRKWLLLQPASNLRKSTGWVPARFKLAKIFNVFGFRLTIFYKDFSSFLPLKYHLC
ncbi:translation initiation factor IF-2-like isoform X1 [Cygnus olor]|uniref:translation initiation factor IF-2-like isoform X1 n=1 Tax=Cygnus olor TaxID=8869 RepID=UPI001ADE090E|nr:translation initiation factor IF-2-like isoform X1 [Cygnus olor]